MKIISLNTWAGKVFDPLMAFFESHRDEVDLFCLQEVFYRSAEHPAFPAHKEGWTEKRLDLFQDIQNVLPNHVGYYAPSQDNFEGLSLFTRKGLAVHREGDEFIFRHRNAMVEDGTTVGRNVQYIELEVDGKRVTVMNFHGWWAGHGMGKGDFPERTQQATNLRAFMDSVSTPKVLLGDFNMLPDTEAMKILERDDMVNLITKNGITNTRSDLYKKDVRFADYALVSPEIEVKHFEVLQDEVSDHLPLLLEI